MNQRASRSFPTLRHLLPALSLSGVVLLSGCGGGGGGGGSTTPPPGTTTLATIRGRVVNASGVGVSGARVTAGAVTANTGTDGTFSLSNVPLATTSFTVAPPTGFDRTYVSFNTRIYDTSRCGLPLPTLTATTYNLSGDISLYSDTTPPPPPPDGCP